MRPRVVVFVLLLLAAACEDTTPQQHVTRAEALLADGELSAAVIELRNALKTQPDMAAARALLGAAYERMADYPGAVREYRRALDYGATDPRVERGLLRSKLRLGLHEEVLEALTGRATLDPADDLILADAYLAAGDLDRARSGFERAADRAAGQLGLGQVAARRGDVDLAQGHLTQALALDPGNGDAWLARGQLELEGGDPNAAAGAFQHAAEFAPSRIAGYLGLAQSQVAQGNLDAASDNLARVTEAAPDYLAARYLMAVVAFQRDDTAAARSTLAEVLARDADYVPALFLKGAIALREGDADDAERSLQKVLDEDDGHEGARALLGSVRFQQGEFAAARDLLAPLAAQDADPGVLATYGAAQLRLGDSDAATRALQRAVSLAPDQAELRNQLAVSLATGGDTAGAEAVLAQAAQVDGDQIESTYLLALLRLQQQDWRGALAAAQALRDRQPENPLGQQLIGAVQLAAGEPTLARQAFESALAIAPTFLPAVESLAQMALAQGDVADAQRLYQSLLDHDPANQDALAALASLYLTGNRPGDAQRVVDAGLKASPDQPELLLLSGQIALQQERPEAARAIAGRLQSQLDTAAAAPGLRMAVAELQARAGMAAEARRNLETLLARNRNDVAVLRALAQLDVRDRSLRSARQRVTRLRQLGDSSPELRLLEGDLELASDHLDGARALYAEVAAAGQRDAVIRLARLDQSRDAPARSVAVLKSWVAAHPADATVRHLLADALSSDRPAEAVAHYERLLDSDDAAVFNNLAWLYHEQGDARAESMARRALQLAPESPSVLDTLGWILAQDGRGAEALDLLEASVHADANPSVLYHLGVTLRDTGDRSGARAAFTRALESDSFPERDATRRALASLPAQGRS